MSRERVIIEPDGWKCSLADCPPGHFMHDDYLCLKTEYAKEGGGIEAFNGAGEAFWGGTSTEQDRAALIVQPVCMRITTEEEA